MTKKKQETTALAVVNHDQWAIAQLDPAELTEILNENLGGDDLSMADFDKITIPAGGGTQWTVTTLEGEDMTEAIEGVVLCQKSGRVYWADDDLTGEPPDCASKDGITGIGDPGGLCKDCPYSEFGSAKHGEAKGQACKQVRQLLVIRQGDVLPTVISLPPTSLRPFKKYLLRLTQAGKRHYGVVTRLSLKREKNANNVPYSVVEPSIVSVMDAASTEFFGQLKQSFEQHFKGVEPALAGPPSE